jgi:hypothetical protein
MGTRIALHRRWRLPCQAARPRLSVITYNELAQVRYAAGCRASASAFSARNHS